MTQKLTLLKSSAVLLGALSFGAIGCSNARLDGKLVLDSADPVVMTDKDSVHHELTSGTLSMELKKGLWGDLKINVEQASDVFEVKMPREHFEWVLEMRDHSARVTHRINGEQVGQRQDMQIEASPASEVNKYQRRGPDESCRVYDPYYGGYVEGTRQTWQEITVFERMVKVGFEKPDHTPVGMFHTFTSYEVVTNRWKDDRCYVDRSRYPPPRRNPPRRRPN